MTRRGWPILAIALALLLSAGCVRRESPVARGDREQVLHRGIGHDLADLDPALATQASDYTVLSALFEGLVGEDPVDLHPVPGVASTWEISPDGTVWTFHLRAEARWSNGDPVTAQDFIESWTRVLTPALAADGAAELYVIQGAEAYNQKDGAAAHLGLAAPDPLTLQVTLEHPCPLFLSRLNQALFFPVHLPTVKASGKIDDRGNPWARPGHMVTNGPFRLERWQAGEEIVVTRSPQYWDRANVHLSAIHFHTIDSLDTEERAFRAGQLHVTDAIPVDRIEAYRRQEPSLLRTDPLLGVYFYRINVRVPGLDDPRIRQALSLAIDREAIVGKILKGGQAPAYAFTPPNTAGYTPQAKLGGTLDDARKLLAAAGHPGGRDLPELALLYNSSETHRVIAEAIQEMWKRELGVRVHLVNQELKGTLEARRSGNFEIMRQSWTADYCDPANFLGIWTAKSGNNYSGWSDPDYDSALFQADRTQDDATRNALYAKAESILVQAAPMIPIYYYSHVFLIRPSVKGWYPTVLDHHPYKAVSLAP